MGRFEKYNAFSSGGGRFAKYSPFGDEKKKSGPDLKTLEGLTQFAEQAGVKVKKDKPSLFSRTVDVLSRPLYASAGAAKSLVETAKGDQDQNLFHEAWKGLKGEEKETYSDVLKEAGVENKYARGIAGFALDVVLDPSTYVGGSLAKGALKGAKVLGKPVGNLATKVAPTTSKHFIDAATSLKDGLGRAFVRAYNTSKGLDDDVSLALNKMALKKGEIFDENIKAFGSIPKEKSKQIVDRLLKHKADFIEEKNLIEKNTIQELNKMFPHLKVGNPRDAKKILDGLEDTLFKETTIIRKNIDDIINSHFKGFKEVDSVKALNNLKKELSGRIKKVKNKAPNILLLDEGYTPASKEEVFATVNKLIGYEEEKLINQIDKLANSLKKSKKLKTSKAKPFTIKKSKKIINPQDAIIREERRILALQNNISDQSRLLEKILDSRRIAKARINAKPLKFSDPNLQRIYDESFKPTIERLAKASKLPEDVLIKDYFPSYSKKQLARKGGENLGNVLQTKTLGGTKAFNNLISDDDLLKKPFEAYTRREYEFARNAFATETLDKVLKTYGRKFKNAKEAAEQGYVAMKDKRFGVIKGYLKADDARFINEQLFPEFKTLDKLAKVTGYDGLTNFFKTAVTAYFPSFHVRNAISGLVQNYSVIGREAFNPKNHNVALGVLKSRNKDVQLAGKVYNLKDLNKRFKEYFGLSSRYISDLGNAVQEAADNSFKVKKISKARRIGNFIESEQKATAMIASLRKGKSIEEALKIAERAGFDYSKITKFEQSIMKRLIPFYTFTRKNAELQLRTLANNPERILNQIKFTKNLSEIFGGSKPTEEDLKGLPPWALSGLGFKVEGNRYLTKFGLPLEEFIERVNNPLGGTLSSMNPIIKYPLESKMGYDFFREAPLEDITKINSALAEALPEELKTLMNVKSYVGEDGKRRYTASPNKLHALRNLPTSRLQGTLEKIFDKDMNKVDKALAFFTGARIYDIDVELQKYFKERDLMRDIEDELLREGEGKMFKTFYQPKNRE